LSGALDPGPLEALRGRLVVSVQAPEGSPLADPLHMVALARAAAAGGATGIRAEGAADVAAIKRALELPVIGLRKRRVPGSEVYITPELEDALEVARAGADVLAVDATLRPRPDGATGPDFVAALARELGRPVLADVDGLDAGLAAREAGAHAVATTLAGYTGAGPVPAKPDLELVAALAAELDCPVLAEGRYATPEAARAALDAGAFAVVVGTAITDPVALTRGFTAALDRRAAHAPN
jgi:N-acylglucosamine-6-phosphate 2-epimerase